MAKNNNLLILGILGAVGIYLILKKKESVGIREVRTQYVPGPIVEGKQTYVEVPVELPSEPSPEISPEEEPIWYGIPELNGGGFWPYDPPIISKPPLLGPVCSGVWNPTPTNCAQGYCPEGKTCTYIEPSAIMPAQCVCI